MTIVEFLTARLDEEQRLAEAATPGGWEYRSNPRNLIGGGVQHYGLWTNNGADVLLQDKARAERVTSGDAAFIAYNDPARVLADVAAKRRIIEWALVFAEDVDGEWGDGHTAAQIKEGQCTGHGSEAALSLLRLLAQPYADHPDFDPAWSVA